MNVNETLHGFRLLYKQELPEIKATLYRMEYEKNGADLCYLDRKDENMSFCIGFKTIPQDSTGVFHIIEHSVLNGSRKYPVREPFVELLKSSMQTFLNAMTYPDKTVYPVASRNKQDFLNLIDVYMDAVLHPLSVENPHAFRQEGWHYELENPEDTLRYNGVVFNEMKGAYSDPDDVLSTEMGALLFPDTCYRFSSGGDPEVIPDLTYENYLASHARFYHPSNSRIFLDGSIDLDAVLGKLDGFLAPYDRIDPDADIAMQAPVHPEEKIVPYEVSPDEAGANRAILARGWVYGDFSEKEKSLAGSILTEMLCGSNEAPLTAALLNAGLCEDVEFSQQDGIQQLYTVLLVRNADPAKRGEIWQLVEDTFRKLAHDGLDHARLHAILNHIEFSTREKDFGSFPKGLAFALNSYDSWLYGGDPAQNFAFDETFAAIRAMIDNGGFERALEEYFISNQHVATLCMLPSTTLGDEKRAKERARLDAERAAMTDADVARVISEFHTLRERQETPDTEEQLKTMPQLSLADIPAEVTPLELTEDCVDGITLLRREADTNGIRYANLLFDVRDIHQDDMPELSLLCTLLTQLATEEHDALALANEISANLGGFTVSMAVMGKRSDEHDCRPYVRVGISCLDSHAADAVRLAGEVLCHTVFTDRQAVLNLIRQTRIALEQGIIGRGNRVATLRALAGFDTRSAVEEQIGGIAQLRYLQEIEKNFDAIGDAVMEDLAAMAQRVFARARLLLELTGDAPEDWARELMELFPEGAMGRPATYQPLGNANEGFTIPADVGYAAKVMRIGSYSGAYQVASQFLGLDFLWNSIRVKGGAYGCGLTVGADRTARFSSYRDPQCARSLREYEKAPEALRTLAESGGSLDRYVISTIAGLDPLQTPRTEGMTALANYLNGVTTEARQKVHTEILYASAKEILEAAEVLEKGFAGTNVCVIGGRNVIDACGDTLKTVEAIQQ